MAVTSGYGTRGQNRRRFDYSVHFRSLTLAQREKIWKNNIRKMDMCGLVPESAAAALAERYETGAGGITMVLENVRRLKPDSAHAAELIERIMRPHCELMHSPIQDGKGRPAQDYSLEGLNIKWDIGLHQMENFDGVMIGATNFFENLDPAVLRRFTFKLEFGYLDDAGKRIFFERTFRTRLTDEEAARLDAVARLAPGDFRTVRQSLYYLGDAVNNAMRLGELEKESGIKSGPSRTKIGF